MTTKADIARWRNNLQGEVDGALVYRGMAANAGDERLAELYARMAEVKEATHRRRPPGGQAAFLSLVLEDGWACAGSATGDGTNIVAACRAADGTAVDVDLSALRQVEDGRVLGRIAVGTGQPPG